MLQELREEYTKKSMEVLNKSKVEYEHAKETYRDDIVRNKKTEIIEEAKAQLRNIKNKYIELANQKLEEEMRNYEQSQIPKSLTTQEAILKELQISNKIKQCEMKYNMIDPDKIINELNTNKEIDELEFNTAKSIAYNKLDDKSKIMGLNYVNPLLNEININKADLKYLECNSEQYLTGFNVNIEESITGESISNYYFK